MQAHACGENSHKQFKTIGEVLLVCYNLRAAKVWLKGKQVQFLYELVTVIREYGFEYWSLMYRTLGRPNLYVDLSARKPASCLVPDIFQDHELLIVLFFRSSVLII